MHEMHCFDWPLTILTKQFDYGTVFILCIVAIRKLSFGLKDDAKFKVFLTKPLLSSDCAQNVTFFNSTILNIQYALPFEIKSATVTFRFKDDVSLLMSTFIGRNFAQYHPPRTPKLILQCFYPHMTS